MPARKKTESGSQQFLSADALVTHINSKFGDNTIIRASDAARKELVRVSTGNTALDIVLDGGLVEGRVHQFRGNFSSTKTTQMHLTAKEYLTKYEDACYVLVDAEGTSDEVFLRDILGFTEDLLSRVFVVTPESGENACDVAVEVAKLGAHVFIGLDSVDALTPTAEIDAEMEKAGVAPGARMMNKFMRKLIQVMKTDLMSEIPRITFVMICQLREKVGVMFGDSTSTWGGKGKEFAAATIIKFARTAWMRDGTKKDGYVYGLQMQAELVKCKGAGHGEVAEYKYYKGAKDGYQPGEFANDEALVLWGVRMGVVKKAGRTYTYDKVSESNLPAFVKKFRTNFRLSQKLLKDIHQKRSGLYLRKK